MQKKETPEQTVANPSVLTKYKAAGDIAQKVLAEITKLSVPGAKIADLCAKGDELINAEVAKVFNNKKDLSKGISFPTSVSVDDFVSYYSPVDSADEKTLADGSVAKICLGAQIDGYASIVSDTVLVGNAGSNPEVQAAIEAAYYATEAALRTVKVGNRNTDVTKIVDQVTKEFNVNALEGMLSMQHQQNQVAGKKRIILNPSEQQSRSFETQKFEENEVYGLDILVTPGSGKTKSNKDKTTIYRKTDLNYKLKLSSSRNVISEVQKKASNFPFNVKILEDQRRAPLALREPVDHGLIEAYEIVKERDGKPVIQFFTTFALTPSGVIKLAAPPKPEIKTEIKNEDIKKVLSTSLKTKKASK